MSEEKKPDRKVWNRIGLKKHLSASIAAFLVIAAAIVFAFCLLKISRILAIIKDILNAASPIIYGIVFSYILKPVYNRLERWLEKSFSKHMKKPGSAEGLAKTLSSIIVVLVVVIFIIAILAVLLPELYNSVMLLTGNLPTYIENARNWLHGILINYPQADEVVMNYFDNFSGMTTSFVNAIFPHLDSVVDMVTSGIGSMMNVLYNVGIGLIVAMYILSEKDKLTGSMRKVGYSIIRTEHVGWFREELRYADKVFSGFVFARFVDSILLGLVYVIIGSLFGIPYVGMISVIIAITNMIPFFGMYIGLVPCALILLLASPLSALEFVIIDIVIMQIDSNLISPRIIGKSTSLSGFWVLFALLFFGGLWGFIGMLIGVPVFAILYHQIKSLVDRRLEKKDMSTNLEDYVRDPVIKEREATSIKKVVNKMEDKFKKDDSKKANSKTEEKKATGEKTKDTTSDSDPKFIKEKKDDENKKNNTDNK